MFIDCFSGAVSDLPKGNRTEKDVLTVLLGSPRVSTWDMSETPWLRIRIASLEKHGLIKQQEEPYPWHKYKVTKEGKSLLNGI